MTQVIQWPGWDGNVWFAARKGKALRTRDYNKKGIQSHEEWLLESTSGPNYGKDAVFFSYGTMRAGQGSRSDLQEFYAHVKAGIIFIRKFFIATGVYYRVAVRLKIIC